MASITEDGTSAANITANHGAGLSSNGSAFVNSGSGQYDGSRHNTAMSTGDHYNKAVIGGKHADNYFDCKIRHNASADGSRNGWQVAVGGSNEYYITEVTAGTGTDRVASTTTFANGDTVEGHASGTTITIKINGSTINSYTSSLYQAQTSVGWGIYRVSTVATFDNLDAADLAGSTTRGRPFGQSGTVFNGGRTFQGIISRMKAAFARTLKEALSC